MNSLINGLYSILLSFNSMIDSVLKELGLLIDVIILIVIWKVNLPFGRYNTAIKYILTIKIVVFICSTISRLFHLIP